MCQKMKKCRFLGNSKQFETLCTVSENLRKGFLYALYRFLYFIKLQSLGPFFIFVLAMFSFDYYFGQFFFGKYFQIMSYTGKIILAIIFLEQEPM